jgi:hypothetical protein
MRGQDSREDVIEGIVCVACNWQDAAGLVDSKCVVYTKASEHDGGVVAREITTAGELKTLVNLR